MKSYFNIEEIEDISSDEFSYDKYIGWLGYSNYEVFTFGKMNNFNSEKFEIIGKCKASSLKIRPKLDGFGLMLFHKINHDFLWLHINI